MTATTNFDMELWRSRSKAHRRLGTDIRFIRAIDKVVRWCLSQGLSVQFTSQCGGIYYPEEKKVTLTSRAQPRFQLFLLLHEIGHFLVASTENHTRYSQGYRNVDPRVTSTFIHRLDIVDEEFEAWARGWSLGERLKILKNDDRIAFDRIRANMLKDYLKWSIKAPGYEDSKDNPSGKTG